MIYWWCDVCGDYGYDKPPGRHAHPWAIVVYRSKT